MSPKGDSIGKLGYYKGGVDNWISIAQKILDDAPKLNKTRSSKKKSIPKSSVNIDKEDQAPKGRIQSVYLKGGGVIKGVVFENQNDSIEVDMGSMKVTLSKEEIERIE